MQFLEWSVSVSYAEQRGIYIKNFTATQDPSNTRQVYK
jgi:hypothetical protein